MPSTSEQPLLRKLSSHNLPWPTKWSQVFGRSLPLILEIGFGYGHYLEHLTQSHPDCNVIGIEISNFCMVKMEKAIPRKKLHNVRVVYSRAETALHHLFEPESISAIHINFPDPWFKVRHSRRRLMQRDTLDAMISRLTPEGSLYLATDIINYAQMTHELLTDKPGLSNMFDAKWVNRVEGRRITKYERRAREEGRECYYFAYQRNNTPVHHPPVIKELDMPHMVISTPLSAKDILSRFSEWHYSAHDTHIKLMNAYRDQDESVLFEMYVREPTIDQHIGIVLVKRDHPEEYTLKLSGIGMPRPTDGLHLAVAALGDKLIDSHPEAKVLKRKVKY